MDEIPTIKRWAGDDWVFTFTSTDANNNPIDLTGRTYEGVLVNPLAPTDIIIGNDGTALLDQTKPETVGKFTVKVSRDITKTLVYNAPQNQNVNTATKELTVRLKVAEYIGGNRETLGSLNIIVRRA